MKEVTLTQGKTAIVDDEDYDLVSQYRWFAHKDRYTFYAGRQVTIGHYTQSTQHMHKLILNADRIDHIDGNGLNNRRSNLRVVTNSQNLANVGKKKGKFSSKYKGVSWYPRYGKWLAYIRVNYQGYNLGYFDNELDAALAYDVAAIKHFGEFAKTNKMLGLI